MNSITIVNVRDACFYIRLSSKSYCVGHTPVQDCSNDTKGEPQNSPCVAPAVQQSRHTVNETCIQSKDVLTHPRLRIAWHT